MRKLGLILLFFTGLQWTLVHIAYDFYSVYRLRTAGSAVLDGTYYIPDQLQGILMMEGLVALGILIFSREHVNILREKLGKYFNR